MLNINLPRLILRTAFILLGAALSWFILTGCKTSKNTQQAIDTTTKADSTKETTKITTAEYQEYLKLKTADSIRKSESTKIPVAVKINGKDTLVYIYKDKFETKYNVKDSAVTRIIKKYDYYKVYQNWDLYHIYKQTITTQSKTSTGGFPFWVVLVAVLIGYLLPKILGLAWKAVKPKLFG